MAEDFLGDLQETESVFGPPASHVSSSLSDNVGFYSQSGSALNESEEELDFWEPDEMDYDQERQLDEILNFQEIRPEVRLIPVAGLTIKFPYDPYPTQIAMATRLVETLQNGTNALIESPTGSGKTVTILCAVLAWLDRLKTDGRIRHARAVADELNRIDQIVPSSSQSTADLQTQAMEIAAAADQLEIPIPLNIRSPKIIYATRTRGQVKQVLKQLRNTHYDSTLTAVVGSRKFSCINEIAKDARAHFGLQEEIPLEDACSKMRDATIEETIGYRNPREPQNQAMGTLNWPACNYFQYHKDPIPADCHTNGRPLDIEDMVFLGRRHNFCPYYALRDQSKKSELTICTHSQLLDPFVRQKFNLQLENAVVIFDEAHNLEASCRAKASIIISESFISNIKTQLQNHQARHMIPQNKLHEWILVFNAVDRLSNWIALHRTLDEGFDALPNSPLSIKNITETFIITMGEIGWSNREVNALGTAIFDLQDLRRELDPDLPPEHHGSLFAPPPTRILRDFGRIVSTFKNLQGPADHQGRRRGYQDYDITIRKVRQDPIDEVPVPDIVELSIQCLNPAVAFKEISDQTRNVILCSGTLSPFNSFATELGVDFQIQESFPHVVPRQQIMSAMISRYSPRGPSLRLSSENWNSMSIATDLANLIVDTCQRIPNGILVFFASGNQLRAFQALWAGTDFEHRLHVANKIVSYETGGENATQFVDLIRIYKDNARNGGAVLFAVMRGRASEGIDYKDDEARAVITLGIPFAPPNDNFVQAKMKYNDGRRDPGYLSGQQWYRVQAQRALNHALGRCIRHVADWGLILVVDSRFCTQVSMQEGTRNRAGLPQWLLASENTRGTESFQDLLPEIYHFVARLGYRQARYED